MTYRRQVKNGQITLDVSLPEGTVVEVKVEPVTDESSPENVWDRLRTFSGVVEGPDDWAKNHNHYIHGTPKLP